MQNKRKKKTKDAAPYHLPIPKDIFALLTNRLLFRLGFGLVGVFVPIFLYQLFDSSLYTLIAMYAAYYTLCVLFIPLGSLLLGVFSVRQMLLMAVPFAVISMGAMYYAEWYPIMAVTVFFGAALLYRILYWVPYQTDMAHFIGHKQVGKHVAMYKNALYMMNAITPLAGGILITRFGFGFVFVFAAAVLLTTVVPTFFIQNVREKYEWSFTETFQKLFAYKNRSLLYAYMADGAQQVVSGVIWPVFIFELLDGKYTSVGFVTSLTVIVILLLNTAVGKFIDRVGEKKALQYSSLLAATGWVTKIFVDSAFQVFAADTYHRLGRAASRTSFDAATYEHAADNGHYIDEFTTLKEIALNIGRVCMLLATVGLLYFFSTVRIVFIVAAGATLIMMVLNKQVGIK